MNKNNILKKRIVTSILVLTILLTSLHMNTTISENDISTNLGNIYDNQEDNKIPESAILGQDDWWNGSFSYRRVINITNPYNINLENYGVSVNFSYVDLIDSGKMNSSFKDVRIVKDNNLINYYIAKDYPSIDQVTIYFDANIVAF